MSPAPLRIGIVGAGMISDQYLTNLANYPDVVVTSIGDIDTQRAAVKADAFDVPHSGTGADVIQSDDVDLVINLTTPAFHAQIAESALAAGKHVWNEKPITTDLASADALLQHAAQSGLRVGVAPDTLLGGGFQTARRLIDSGVIGTPLTASTTLQFIGPDIIHPSPEFLFTEGGGPLLDMGPYYFSALVSLFGPVTRVAGLGAAARTKRTIRVGEKAGQNFPVTIPTHVVALAEFEGGQISESTFSFDSALTRRGVIEVTGTEGAIVVPDPNRFGGEIRYTRNDAITTWPIQQEWTTVSAETATDGRGLGVVDMARSIAAGVPHICSGDLAYHVLEILEGIIASTQTHRFTDIASTIDNVPGLPAGWDPLQRALES